MIDDLGRAPCDLSDHCRAAGIAAALARLSSYLRFQSAKVVLQRLVQIGKGILKFGADSSGNADPRSCWM